MASVKFFTLTTFLAYFKDTYVPFAYNSLILEHLKV